MGGASGARAAAGRRPLLVLCPRLPPLPRRLLSAGWQAVATAVRTVQYIHVQCSQKHSGARARIPPPPPRVVSGCGTTLGRGGGGPQGKVGGGRGGTAASGRHRGPRRLANATGPSLQRPRGGGGGPSRNGSCGGWPRHCALPHCLSSPAVGREGGGGGWCSRRRMAGDGRKIQSTPRGGGVRQWWWNGIWGR